jgi:fatty acid desaturase
MNNPIPGLQSALPRQQIYYLSRTVIVLVVVAAEGTYFLTPPNPVWYLIDILSRTYLIFIGTVMAHEGAHGHLGSTKKSNFWWGRLALLPSLVPFTNFQKTHRLHHGYTNVPEMDPDYFMKPRRLIEIPLRAVAMPHHWFFWLRKRDRISRKDLFELGMNYLGLVSVHVGIALVVGPERILNGLLLPLIIVSILLWYPFAVQTHEGFSTGSAELRSHNYYGQFMYWFSLGLSMHRTHHSQPKLSWIELRRFVESAPKGSRAWFRIFGRDVRPPQTAFPGTAGVPPAKTLIYQNYHLCTGCERPARKDLDSSELSPMRGCERPAPKDVDLAELSPMHGLRASRPLRR